MGTASAWLPSRKSTLHHRGAAFRVRLGQRRSTSSTGGNGRYFFDGSLSIYFFPVLIGAVQQKGKRKPTARSSSGFSKVLRKHQNPTAALHSSSALDSSRFRFKFTLQL